VHEPVFADTSFYAAIINRRDQVHARAKEAAGKCDGPIITSEYVLVETANFCLHGRQRAVYLMLVANLRATANVEIVPAETALFQRGLDLFGARPDKDRSLTDCISISIMQERGLRQALTADQNFEQAGFVALLR
jgi:predicted nucleic acid-binding protein